MATNLSTYKFNHTMLRVKDPVKSLAFYKLLGMEEIKRLPNDGFTLYFLASPAARAAGGHWTSCEGLIELTHNHGTETQPDFPGYHNGNSEPRGFGHVCVSVDNIQAACARLEAELEKAPGLTAGFKKKLTDGRMRHIAFVLDPDNYWVEIISPNPLETTGESKVESYLMNHSMIRVKDPQKSLEFYRTVLGMKLKRVSKNSDFDLYFLGYPKAGDAPDDQEPTQEKTADQEGLLELTHNHGTEHQPDFQYANGNQEPRGFGHIGITVDDIDAACARFETLEAKGVEWQLRLGAAKSEIMKNIAFLRDPDGYWIEIVQNEDVKKRVLNIKSDW